MPTPSEAPSGERVETRREGRKARQSPDHEPETGGESRGGTHNPLVAGSSPARPTTPSPSDSRRGGSRRSSAATVASHAGSHSRCIASGLLSLKETSVPSSAIDSFAPWWRGLHRAFTELCHRRHQRRELQLLDSCAFRDLAIDRSELSSFDAEAAGIAPPSRLRVAGAVPARQQNRHTLAHTAAS
jgi:uncharacterized protein YjiS (DUF1127 family)